MGLRCQAILRSEYSSVPRSSPVRTSASAARESCFESLLHESIEDTAFRFLAPSQTERKYYTLPLFLPPAAFSTSGPAGLEVPALWIFSNHCRESQSSQALITALLSMRFPIV